MKLVEKLLDLASAALHSFEKKKGNTLLVLHIFQELFLT